MAEPGWYPDPGDPARLRYFDGERWTAATRPPTPAAPAASRRRGVRTGVALAAVVAVVLVLLAVGAVRLLGGTDDRSAPDPQPSTSVSAWDDSSPSADQPAPSPTDSAPQVPCIGGGANQLGDPVADGRVHGGPLSFAALPRSWAPARATRRWFFARDSWVQTQVLPEKLGWQASAQVGVVDATVLPDGSTGDATARRMLDCLVDSDFYTRVSVRESGLMVRPTTVGAVPATRLDVTLDFSHPQLKTKGSAIVIMVVDSQPATYYFHAVPKERADLITELDTVIASLRVG